MAWKKKKKKLLAVAGISDKEGETKMDEVVCYYTERA